MFSTARAYKWWFYITLLLSFTIIFLVCIPSCSQAKSAVASTKDPTCEYYYGSITGPDKCWCSKPLPGEVVGGGESFTTVDRLLCRQWLPITPKKLQGD